MKPKNLLAAMLFQLGGISFASTSPVRADRILIEKAAHRLTLFKDGVGIKTYKVALGRHPVGPKEKQGDKRTPEGLYTIDARKDDSSYHRALHVAYPNDEDKARAAKLGVDPGGDIMIHGIRNGLGWLGPLHRTIDWTAGCIAVTDAQIDEIIKAVPIGTPVEIRP
jgi:murein L,D-transpeptidase YafK